MIEKEYLTVKDLSKYHKVGARHIRKIIEKIKPDTTPQLIYKDANNTYMVHHILTSKFKPSRIHNQKYYALTVTPSDDVTEKLIHEVMRFVVDKMEGPNLEINYTIERKKATGQNHLHCYINCNQKRKLIELLRLGFSRLQYHESEIFDLENWKKYMTKDGNKITTIKKD